MSKRKRGLSKQARAGHGGNKGGTITLAADPWASRPDTAAQRAGTVVRDVQWTDPDTGKRSNPNGVRGIYREPLLERMWRAGTLTARQFNAATLIRDAFEATQQQPPAINPIQVDTFPNPAAVIVMQTDRQSRLATAMRAVPITASAIVVHVCCMGEPLSAFKGVTGGRSQEAATQALCEALEAVAARFRM